MFPFQLDNKFAITSVEGLIGYHTMHLLFTYNTTSPFCSILYDMMFVEIIIRELTGRETLSRGHICKSGDLRFVKSKKFLKIIISYAY